MSITYQQFVTFAFHFEKISNTLSDGWKIDYVTDRDSKILYLRKAVFSNSADIGAQVMWDYNIIFSNSYNVPVLYFNACFDTGKLLSLENLESFIDDNFKEQFVQNKWNTLTQQEHPFTRTPCFMLHPCGTEEFMKSFETSKINPLITWLSTIAPMINLNLNHQYGSSSFLFDESENQ